jgi:hypothetical protein
LRRIVGPALGAMGADGVKIKGVTDATREIAGIVGFLQYGQSFLLCFLEQRDIGAVARVTGTPGFSFEIWA